MSAPVSRPRLTVLITSNPQMDGRHFRELRMMNHQGNYASTIVGRLGQMSDVDAEQLQKRLDEIIAAEREDAVEDYRISLLFDED